MSNYTNTGKKIKDINGNEFTVYEKLTKNGIQYYTYCTGFYLPIFNSKIFDK